MKGGNRMSESIERPWLVQRCELSNDGKLRYDYMGSAEFEVGDQARSLKRIFAKGMRLDSVSVIVDDKEVVVYMIAAEEFPFADYKPYLQQMADNTLRLKEWTNFDDAIKAQLGLETTLGEDETNVWFDFKNDVLWTLTEDNQTNLVSAMESIKQAWAKK